MPSDYDSDREYDTSLKPEAGRAKQQHDSDESDNERPSGPLARRAPAFLGDDGNDDEDEVPMTADDNRQHDRSSSASSSAPAATVNHFRKPAAFAAPNPTTSSGPAFYHKDKTKTPTHSAMSTDGTSMFCVEGYVNTPELSAGRGGGLSQGLAANGPYKSLFRAKSRSQSRASASANNRHETNATTSAPALHVLAEAAQSPEALSPVSATASLEPAPTPASAPTSAPPPKKRSRRPSPLIASTSPASPVAPLDPISATRSSPVASTNLNASPSSSQSHIIIHPSPPPRHPRAKSGGGDSTSGKGKQRETLTPEAPGNGNDEGSEQRYERGILPPSPQLSERPSAELHEPESVVQDHPRNVQKHKNRAASSEEVGPLPEASPAPADHSYDHAEGDCFSSFEAGPSGASDIACEGGQNPSSPQAIVSHYPTSAPTTTSKESPLALMTDSRSVTPGTKPCMMALLIEDRRLGTNELTAVIVPLKAAGEGNLWADAKDVCVALQSGPARIDGPAKVFTERGKYRQTFLRISADGEETTLSVNLKVETNRVLPVVVEGISDPHAVMGAPFLSSNPSWLVSTGPGAPDVNPVHPPAPVSDHLGLDEVGQRTGDSRKRKRETSLSQVQKSPFGSPAARNMPTLHEQYHGPPRNNPIASGGEKMSDSPPAACRSRGDQQGREQTYSGSFLDCSGDDTDQPSQSVVSARPGPSSGCSSRRKMISLQPPPAPIEGSQCVDDKVVSFLQDRFMEDTLDWNEFSRDRAHVGSLNNVALLSAYWFAQKRLESWVESRLSKHLNYKIVEVGHVFDALGVTEDWYRECNETLSLVIAYGERGERWESPRAVAACCDREQPKLRHPSPSPGTGSSGGPTDLLVLLREVHEEYCDRIRGRVGQGQGRGE